MRKQNEVYFWGKSNDNSKVNYREVSFDIDQLNNDVVEIAKSYQVDEKAVYCYAYAVILKAINDNSFFCLGYCQNGSWGCLDIDLSDELNESGIRKINSQIMNPYSMVSNFDELNRLTDSGIYFNTDIDNNLTFTICINEKEGKTSCELRGADVFLREGQLEFVFRHFEAAIKSLADSTCKTQNDICLISDYEKDLIDGTFNNNSQAFSEDLCIHQVFEKRAKSDPDNLLIKTEDTCYTYAQVNEITDHIAKGLRDYINREDVVMIISDRSPEMIFSVYAVMKAGGCYVPVDKKLPVDRIKYIIGDCKPKCILATTPVDLGEIGIPAISFQNLMDRECTDDVLENINAPSDLAVIIYTSGTTGRPKGVQIEHHSVVNYCEFNYKRFEIGPGDVVLQFASFMFSTYILELNTPAFGGACICIIKEEYLKNIPVFEKFIDEHGITLLLLPPQYCMYIKPTPKVRIVQTGGMMTTRDVVIKIKDYCKYLNGYGLSEGGVCAVWEYEGGDVPNKIPIGKPVSNVQLHVCNGDKECGIFMPGELCVTGQSIARGYVGNEELTKQKFVQNPFGPGRMLRTGDIVQWLPDGNVEYLGRRDTQVQLNGIRVEVDEVENVLRKVSGIKNGVIVAHKSQNENMYLWAYYISEEELSEDAIREEMGAVLPQYMIPSLFFRIEQIPLTENGKIDVSRLPVAEIDEEIHFSDDTSGKIAKIAYDITKKKIDINANFLQAGMNSLDIIRLISKVEEEFLVALTLDEVYNNASINELAKLIEQEASNSNRGCSIAHGEEKECNLATNVQLGVYLDCVKTESNKSYNLPFLFKYKGKLDVDRLENCLADMVSEHAILRTSFVFENNQLVQRISKNATIKINRGNIDEMKDVPKALESLIRPFDLEKAPLVRLHVFEQNDLSETEVGGYIFFDVHHIIFDGISLNLFVSELFERYFGREINKNEVQFYDYCNYASELSGSEREAYFKNRMEKENYRAVELITDYEESDSLVGNTVYASIPKQLKAQIKELCAKLHITEYAFYCTAYAIMLSKYTNSKDVAFGTMLAGREMREVQDVLGMFVNTLILNFHITDHSVVDMLKENMEQIVQIQKNQSVSRETVVGLLEDYGYDSMKSILEVLFVFENMGESDLDYGELKLDRVLIPEHEVQSKMALIINIGCSENEIELEYRTSSFTRESVEWYTKHYLCILAEMLETSKKCCDIEMLEKDEKQMVLSQFNDTDCFLADRKRVANIFEDQVKKFPGNIAVADEDENYTYEELNVYAARIAAMLNSKGVLEGMKVSVIAKRKCFAVAAMLGIIKNNSVYIPIDHAYPQQRIQYILDDSEAKLVITDYDDIFDGVATLNKEEIVDSDVANNYLFTKEGDVELPLYVIYTSGTTGNPKGIIINNSGVNDLREHFIRNQGITPSDNVLQFASLSFDASISELSMSILCGATLHIASEEMRNDVYLLKKFIQDRGITIGILPPMFLDIIDISMMRSVISAGAELLPKTLEKHSNIRISNDYGPTEVTVCATHFEYKGQSLTKRVPIGKPIENKQIYMLNEGELCGVYVPGEICVAGSGLAREYLNQVELTQKSFCENPFGEGRMYHTGDLGRWLPDGNIEFLGRIDEQVKINGYRVEVKEVESVVKSCDKVENAAVCCMSVGGEKALCAYLVINDAEYLTMIKDECATHLPKYMMPTYWFSVDEIPFTVNGKLDTRKLAKNASQFENEIEKPSNDKEEILCEIFQKLLHKEVVGVNESFMSIGGNSLLAMRLSNEIEEKFHVRMKVRDILSDDTVRGIYLKMQDDSEESESRIPKAESKMQYNLSPNQLGIYLFCQNEPDSVAYNMPQYIKLHGQLQIEQLREALVTMCKKHSILRTSFVTDREQVYQRISNEVVIDLVHESVAEGDVAEAMRRFVQPFDLSKAPLFRVKLKEVAMNEYILMFDIHHIISDGISMANFLKELENIYNGVELNKYPDIQFVDYSEWMHALDASGDVAYWKDVYMDEVPVLDFPTDYRRPLDYNDDGSIVHMQLDAGLSEHIKSLARKMQVTEYSIFVTALSILCQKYSRQDDFVIGTVAAGRTKRELESAIGMFVNTIPLRIQLDAESEAGECIRNMHERCLETFEHQNCSFENIVQSLNIRGNQNRNPMFDIMFVMQNMESIGLNLAGITNEAVDFHGGSSKFDLTFQIDAMQEDYKFSVEYKTSLFSKSSIQNYMRYYINILEQLTTNLAQRVNKIELMDGAERTALINQIQSLKAEYDENEVIANLFAKSAAIHADRIALSYGSQQMTYKELDGKSNSLAYELRSRGAGPEKFVCLYMDKSIEMIISIIAVVKSGAAYVPIYTNYPKVRVDYIVEDCDPSIILTNKDSEMFESDQRVLNISLDNSSLYNAYKEPLDIVTKPEDALYVIYTSGTTGKPKGVVIENRNLVRLFFNSKQPFAFSNEDVWTMFHAYGFDFSVWEMYGALLYGGKLVVVSEEVTKDSYQFLKLLIDERVTILNQVPSSFYNLMGVCSGESLALRYVIFGGEALNVAKIYDWHKKYPYVRLINMYGITETTVHVTYCEVSEKEMKEGTTNIGNAIPTLQMYIMKDGCLCGIGEPGEICVSGAGVSRGYLNKDELTQQKFIDNPFGSGRMYRSGDLAKRCFDGSIQYIGRMDDQTQLHGFRVELGEIESALKQIEGIVDSVAIVKTKDDGDSQIYGYYISELEYEYEYLRNRLQGLIPSYMVPSHIIRIDEIPTTINGKLNRSALPDEEDKGQQEYVAPINEAEEVLCRTLDYVLNKKSIGRTDNFYELGGDSISALRVVSKLRSYGYEVSVKSILKQGIVSNIACEMEKSTEFDYDQAELTGVVTNTPIIEEFNKWNQPVKNYYNQAVMISVENDKLPSLLSAFGEIVKHHDLLRAVFKNQELVIQPYNQDHCFKYYEFEIENPSMAKEFIVEKCECVQSEIDLENGPLMHVAAFKGLKDVQVMICVHHLAIDGVSWRILMEDIENTISQIDLGNSVKLPVKTASYDLWANSLNEYFEEIKSSGTEEKYWLDLCSKASNFCFQYNEIAEINGYKQVLINLNEEETENLIYKSDWAYHTEIQDILLSALGLAINKVTGTKEAVVYLEGHGRYDLGKNNVHVERTVGWFTNIYPVAVRCASDVEESIIANKEMLRSIPNYGIGYGAYVKENESDYNEICFNYLGNLDTQSAIAVSEYDCGRCVSEKNYLPGHINLNGSVANGKLSFALDYVSGSYNDEEMQLLADTFKQELLACISHCIHMDDTVRTISDITTEDISDDDLEMFDEFDFE